MMSRPAASQRYRGRKDGDDKAMIMSDVTDGER
jgi:hypothetical protein